MVTSASWTEATAPVSATRSVSAERIRRTFARAARLRDRSAITRYWYHGRLGPWRTGVLRGVEPPQRARESEAEVRPQGRVAPVAVQVPALAAPLQPHRPGHPLLDRVVPFALGARVDLHGLQPGGPHVVEGAHHVTALRLGHVDDRVVTQPRVRPEQQEEVREPGDRRPVVRLRTPLPVGGHGP